MRYADRHRGKTKQDVLDEIGARLKTHGVFNVSTGSTEPKAFLEAIVQAFGMGIDLRLTKPELAQAIANAAGVPWDSSCDSRQSASGGGSTITFEGLCRLFESVKRLGE